MWGNAFQTLELPFRETILKPSWKGYAELQSRTVYSNAHWQAVLTFNKGGNMYSYSEGNDPINSADDLDKPN
jgi:hypothetical protein